MSGLVSNKSTEIPGDPSWQEQPKGQIRFRDSIAGKITIRSLLLAATPVLIVGLLTIASLFLLSRSAESNLEASRTELVETAVGARRAEQADVVLTKMDLYIDERVNDVIDWSRAPQVRQAAAVNYAAVEEIEGLSIEEIEARFQTNKQLDISNQTTVYLVKEIDGLFVPDATEDNADDKPIYAELFFTDINGYIVGASGSTTDFVQSDEEWWQTALAQGILIESLQFDESAKVNSFSVSVRIDDDRGQPIGVMKAVIDASVIQTFADEIAREDVQVRVLSRKGLILADTITAHEAVGQSARDLPILQPEQASAFNTARDRSDQAGFLQYDNAVFGYAKSAETRRVERLGLELESESWLAFVEQPTESAFRPLQGLEDTKDQLNFSTLFLTLVIAALIIITLLLAFLISRLVANRIAGPIDDLRAEANWVADYQLPELIQLLQDPSTKSLPVVEPIDVDADGEVGELASAFNAVRSTAIELAGTQAMGRSRDVAGILMNLGRRNQQLIGRQLQFIDELEQSESDPDTLRNLFLLDQMTTRMRRNAESLLVLAGEDSPRRGTAPLAIEDVIRAASGEVEDYARVQIDSIESVMVRPDVVSDLTHLLAELIENAASFSPPDTDVEIVGSQGFDGSYTISIVDHGVGMSREKMDEANRRLAAPTFSEGVSTSFLGLFVVGRLASRHGIHARVVESATTGITAKIGLPAVCLIDNTDGSSGYLDRQLTPVGAPPATDEYNDTSPLSQLGTQTGNFDPLDAPLSPVDSDQYPAPEYDSDIVAPSLTPIEFDDPSLEPAPVVFDENEVALPEFEMRQPGAQTPGSLPGINLQTPYAGHPLASQSSAPEASPTEAGEAHSEEQVPSVLPAPPEDSEPEQQIDADSGKPILPFHKRESKAPAAGETVSWVAGTPDADIDPHAAVGGDTSPEDVEDKAERARTLLDAFTRGQKQAITGNSEETE